MQATNDARPLGKTPQKRDKRPNGDFYRTQAQFRLRADGIFKKLGDISNLDRSVYRLIHPDGCRDCSLFIDHPIQIAELTQLDDEQPCQPTDNFRRLPASIVGKLLNDYSFARAYHPRQQQNKGIGSQDDSSLAPYLRYKVVEFKQEPAKWGLHKFAQDALKSCPFLRVKFLQALNEPDANCCED